MSKNAKARRLPVGVYAKWRKDKVCRDHRLPFGSDDCTTASWVYATDAHGDRIPTGKYVVQVPVPDPATGKTRLKGGTHTTLTAARKEAERIRSDRETGRC